MHIVVHGNCQAWSIAASLRFHRPDDTVNIIAPSDTSSEAKLKYLRNLLRRADIVISQTRGDKLEIGPDEVPVPARSLHLRLPTIAFTGFHPDQSYILRADNSFLGPFSPYSSKLTVFGLLRGLSPEQTLKLFQPGVYEALGWDFDTALSAFISFAKEWDLDPSPYVGSWLQHGCFMHTINHPKLRAVSDLTAAALKQAGLKMVNGNCADYLTDPLAWQIWPVIPGLNVPGGASATTPVFLFANAEGGINKQEFLTLDRYVHRVHAALPGLSETDLQTEPGLALGKLDRELASILCDLRGVGKGRQDGGSPGNPYKGLPGYHFWRKSISGQPLKSINPMVNAPFKVAQEDRIATAGSCFAQHIAKRLARSGYNYYIAEPPPKGMSETEAGAKSYGIFSARYGNIYTVRQLLQLLQRATGKFKPADTFWPSRKSGYIDPFRPEIEPESALSAEDVRASAEVHLAAAGEMFRNLDVFIFTLGLTEAWHNKLDGAVFPLAPGVVSTLPDDGGIGFVNFGFDEVRADLFSFIEELHAINPAARVVLTVSPVPLLATYEDRHVLTSTVASKSILRAVADEASRKLRSVMYFPSYEIITMASAKGDYFEADMRSVRKSGIDHVMRAFFESCATPTGEANGTGASKRAGEALSEFEEIARVVCDEEQIVAEL